MTRERLSRKQMYILICILEIERLKKKSLKKTYYPTKEEAQFLTQVFIKEEKNIKPGNVRWRKLNSKEKKKHWKEKFIDKANFMILVSQLKNKTKKKSIYRALDNMHQKGLIKIIRPGKKDIKITRKGFLTIIQFLNVEHLGLRKPLM